MAFIRSIRIALARRAYERAHARYEAYQSQPSTGQWAHPVAMLLSREAERAALHLAHVANGR